MTMERVKIPIRFSSGSNDHPDEWWDPNALPVEIPHHSSSSGSKLRRAVNRAMKMERDRDDPMPMPEGQL
ncbi:hypothetical protein AAC387_Pa07g1316 [Persea americana]